MAKKVLLAMIIAIFAAGGVFAQSNTITVDVGPTIAGFAVGPLGSKAISKFADNVSDDIDISGFGIAAQYERQLFSQLSVAVRGVYGSFKGGLSYEEGPAKAKPELDITSLAAEGHVRFYPFGETFFLDGMLGWARLSADVSGQVVAAGMSRSGNASESSDYLKYGAKVGWRMSFGDKGGFTFEPSIGYYLGTPLGDSLGKKVSDSLSKSIGYQVEGIDDVFKYAENYVFIGGPRLSLAFGYRF